MANYSGTRLQIGRHGVRVRKGMKNSLSCAHVLHKTLNLVTSLCCFAEDCKEMLPKLKTQDCLFFLINV